MGAEIYRKPPWAVYRKGDAWIYAFSTDASPSPRPVAVFRGDYSRGHIFRLSEDLYHTGRLNALTLFPSDQIWIAQLLARRRGFSVHSSAVSLDNQGFLFVGSSAAGKSTIARLLAKEAQLLCDETNIVREWPDGFRVHGTWSHGEIATVSPAAAPLRAILFLQQSIENRLIPISRPGTAAHRLITCIFKPLETVPWWDQTLATVQRTVESVPCFELHFRKDNSESILSLLRGLTPQVTR